MPGVATWKPSICPLCNAGCGVIARVMEGDAEVFRNGQAGRDSHGPREEARRQSRGCDQPGQAVRARPGRDSDHVSPRSPRQAEASDRGERGSGQFADITWDEAIKELTGKLNELAAANDQASLAFLTKPRRGRRLELIARAAAAIRREAAGDLRVVLGRGAAARERDRLRLASAADLRSRERALRDFVRRGFPRHVEFSGRAERGVRTDAPGAARHAAEVRAR